MPEETMQPCSDPLAWICKKFSCYYLDRTCHFQLGQDLTQHAHLLNMLSMFSFPFLPDLNFNPADLGLQQFLMDCGTNL